MVTCPRAGSRCGRLKLGVRPLVAYAVAHLALGLSGHALLAVVVCSSLPTAQNIFVHATRYDRSPTLARDTILVTTIGAVPLITLVVGCWLTWPASGAGTR